MVACLFLEAHARAAEPSVATRLSTCHQHTHCTASQPAIKNPTLARNTASKQASKHSCCNKHAGKHASFSTHETCSPTEHTWPYSYATLPPSRPRVSRWLRRRASILLHPQLVCSRTKDHPVNRPPPSAMLSATALGPPPWVVPSPFLSFTSDTARPAHPPPLSAPLPSGFPAPLVFPSPSRHHPLPVHHLPPPNTRSGSRRVSCLFSPGLRPPCLSFSSPAPPSSRTWFSRRLRCRALPFRLPPLRSRSAIVFSAVDRSDSSPDLRTALRAVPGGQPPSFEGCCWGARIPSPCPGRLCSTIATPPPPLGATVTRNLPLLAMPLAGASMFSTSSLNVGVTLAALGPIWAPSCPYVRLC